MTRLIVLVLVLLACSVVAADAAAIKFPCGWYLDYYGWNPLNWTWYWYQGSC